MLYWVFYTYLLLLIIWTLSYSTYNRNPVILSSSICNSLVRMIAFNMPISRSLDSSDDCSSTRELGPRGTAGVPLLHRRNTGLEEWLVVDGGGGGRSKCCGNIIPMVLVDWVPGDGSGTPEFEPRNMSSISSATFWKAPTPSPTMNPPWHYAITSITDDTVRFGTRGVPNAWLSMWCRNFSSTTLMLMSGRGGWQPLL